MNKNLVIGLKGTNIIISLKKLIVKVDHGKRVIFNIKRSFNNFCILGEPVFMEYWVAFDYLNNRVGFSGKR